VLALNVLAGSLNLAAIYLLLSLGWVIIYRGTGLLNFAHGQFVMVGAYLYYELAVVMSLPWWLALSLALVLGAGLSALTFFGLLRPVTGQPMFAQVVLTMGLSIVMTSIVSMIWGPTALTIPRPFPNHVIHLPLGATVTVIDLGVAAGAIAAVLLLLLVFERTRLGVHMRATAESTLLSSLGGINVAVIAAVSWAIAGAMVTLGGIAFSQQSLLSLGVADIGMRGIAPALLGGLDSIKGALVGSVIVALMQNFGVLLFGGTAADVSAYVVILGVVMVFRPTGLFGSAEVRRI
jgi:branched-chain amino acid transport system permease protein